MALELGEEFRGQFLSTGTRVVSHLLLAVFHGNLLDTKGLKG